MSTTTTAPTTPPVTTDGWRPGALTGLGFVLAVLTGNSLTESAAGNGALADLTALSSSTAARLGLGLELLAFVLLLVFASEVAARGARGAAAHLSVLAAAVMVAVKLGSGAAVLGAAHDPGPLDQASAELIVGANDAAFVLSWLGFGGFVAAGAVALAAAGALGRVLRTTGLGLGVLTVAAGVVGSVVPAAAVPIPFLLALLWTGVVSVRLSVPPRARADSVAPPAA